MCSLPQFKKKKTFQVKPLQDDGSQHLIVFTVCQALLYVFFI